MDCKLVHSLGHRAGVAVDRGLLAEHRLELGGRQGVGVEFAEPLLQRQRAEEGMLHGDLLVEREAHQQRQRVGGDEGVGFV